MSVLASRGNLDSLNCWCFRFWYQWAKPVVMKLLWMICVGEMNLRDEPLQTVQVEHSTDDMVKEYYDICPQPDDEFTSWFESVAESVSPHKAKCIMHEIDLS